MIYFFKGATTTTNLFVKYQLHITQRKYETQLIGLFLYLLKQAIGLYAKLPKFISMELSPHTLIMMLMEWN
jgi:hypothetical protein